MIRAICELLVLGVAVAYVGMPLVVFGGGLQAGSYWLGAFMGAFTGIATAAFFREMEESRVAHARWMATMPRDDEDQAPKA